MARLKHLCVIGTSFRTASLDARAACSLGTEESEALLRALKPLAPDLEALVLSTCNRTELYLAGAHAFDAEALFKHALRSVRPHADLPQVGACTYRHEGAAAVRHLFRVASGLDSAILGDQQVLGQLKRAFEAAVRAGAAGHCLHRTVGFALRCGKRARRETGIATGAAGIGSAMVSLLARRLPPAQTPPRILVLGAGKVACDAGRLIVHRLSGTPCFLSRTPERAAETARKCGGTSEDWSELPRLLRQADAVIAATSAPHAVLQREALDEAIATRGGRPLLVLDAGLPRNVEEGSRAQVFDLEYIRRHQDETLGLRKAAVPAAERIVDEETLRWRSWAASLQVEPLIKQLFENAERERAKHATAVAFWMHREPLQAELIAQKNHRRALHEQVRSLREGARSAELSQESLARFAPGFH